jgi:hypothetical protein
MEVALATFDANLPANTKGEDRYNEKGQRPYLPNRRWRSNPSRQTFWLLTAALVQRWPMANLLDILKETELGSTSPRRFARLALGNTPDCRATCVGAYPAGPPGCHAQGGEAMWDLTALGGPASWRHAGRSSFHSRRLPVSFLDWPRSLEDPTPCRKQLTHGLCVPASITAVAPG